MRKLVENCVHSFVKNPMNFMNLKGLFLQSVTLPAAPRGPGGKWGTGAGPNGGDLEEKREKKGDNANVFIQLYVFAVWHQ